MKSMFNVLTILGALLIVMSIVMLLISPIGGIAGAAIGALCIWYGITTKKKYLAGELAPKQEPSAPSPVKEQVEIVIAGTYYHQDDLARLAKALELDPDSDFSAVDLEFVPEPDNEYDPNALKAIVTEDDKEYFIGYCPKEETGLVRKAIDANMTIDGEIRADDGVYYASAYISK